jgi:hypothetical protein
MLFLAAGVTELSEALLVAGGRGKRWPNASSTSSPAPTPDAATRRMRTVSSATLPYVRALDVDQATAHYRRALTLAEEIGMRPPGPLPPRPGMLYAAAGSESAGAHRLPGPSRCTGTWT